MRWIVAAAGTGLMAVLGTVYSWSLYAQPLAAAFGWSASTTTWAFAFAIFFLGDRKSTRLNSSHNSESRMPSSA
jgi:hypothetical protein